MENEYDAEKESSIPIAVFAGILAHQIIEFAESVVETSHRIIQFSSIMVMPLPLHRQEKLPHFLLSLKPVRL